MTARADEQTVSITAGPALLPGIMGLPDDASGLVIFAHGSGSSRLSQRNNFVARRLREGGMGTLLFDLLTADEDRVYERRFDIGLLTTRLVQATRWLRQQPQGEGLALGYFGASTGSAAALNAAVELGDIIRAVVSRGGRPDMAQAALPRVQAATLLIVGGDDLQVLDLNRQAYAMLNSAKHLAVIPGAGHLFEEPGALEQVARLAAQWFQRYLPAPPAEPTPARR